MAGRGAGVFWQMHRLWDLGTFVGLTDAQLLTRFVDRGEDDAESAFEALVERHGSMVLRVCRGVLGDEHAAEDAFQATFLVLARKAASLSVKDSLASWLYGVAHRVAARARVDAARRRRHEQQLAKARGDTLEVMPDHPRHEAWAILSEEIARLPQTYRTPVVLCYLEAMSYQAAAASLGVTEDTVRGRLARARERLRKRLTRRGFEVTTNVAVTWPATSVGAVRNGLVQATARAAAGVSTGGSMGLGTISQSAISLYERTWKTMMLSKLKAFTAALMLGGVTAGAIVSAQPPALERNDPSGPATKSPRPPRAVPAKDGNFIVDWIPVGDRGGKTEVTVDPTRHCTHLPWVSQKRDDRPNDGAVRVELERGKVYKITAAGEAFMSEHTGVDADPFPGVVVIYPTDEEDCFAIRQIVLASGKSITFRAPWLIDPNSETFLLAFFLDTYAGDRKRGRFKLTIEETGEQNTQVPTSEAPFVRMKRAEAKW